MKILMTTALLIGLMTTPVFAAMDLAMEWFPKLEATDVTGYVLSDEAVVVSGVCGAGLLRWTQDGQSVIRVLMPCALIGFETNDNAEIPLLPALMILDTLGIKGGIAYRPDEREFLGWFGISLYGAVNQMIK